MDLAAERDQAAEIIRHAGTVALDYFERPHTIDTKSSAFDIVTEADKGVEVVLVDALTKAFPNHHIVGEEGGGMGAPIDEADYRWYIDPIDGTTNFSRHIPFFGISMGLTDRDLNPLVGAVLDPVSGSLFCAAQGLGATHNDKPIQVAPTDSLQQAMFVTGFPFDVATQQRINTGPFLELLPKTQGVRRIGSAALELSFVACGRFDGFWESRLKPWDCMAGILLVREAGGRVTDYSGGEQALTGAEIIASNGKLHQALMAVIDKYTDQVT
jgi:myo-inositol-1(or 4)-monophosphatase